MIKADVLKRNDGFRSYRTLIPKVITRDQDASNRSVLQSLE